MDLGSGGRSADADKWAGTLGRGETQGREDDDEEALLNLSCPAMLHPSFQDLSDLKGALDITANNRHSEASNAFLCSQLSRK